ncbi:MAG: hypothetical protein ACYTXY_07585 [Nostoc sp.]
MNLGGFLVFLGQLRSQSGVVKYANMTSTRKSPLRHSALLGCKDVLGSIQTWGIQERRLNPLFGLFLHYWLLESLS